MGIKPSIPTKNVSNPTLLALFKETGKRNLPSFRLREEGCFIGIGEKIVCLNYLNSSISSKNAKNKSHTSELLSNCKIPVPKYVTIDKKDIKNYRTIISKLTPPFVVKPIDSGYGRGITLGIKIDSAIKKAFAYALEHGDKIIVEEFLDDVLDYRLTFFRGKYLGCVLTPRENVIGDGKKSIKELIKEHNIERKKKYNLPPLTHEWIFKTYLAQYNYTLDSIPPKNKVVRIYGRGGIYENASNKVHPENIELCRNACQILGLKFAGVDFMSIDASVPYYKNGAVINEINSRPHVGLYQEVLLGNKVNLAEKIIKIIFPKNENAWIPIEVEGKTITDFKTLKQYLKIKPKEVNLKDPKRTIKNAPLPLLSYLINFKTKKINI